MTTETEQEQAVAFFNNAGIARLDLAVQQAGIAAIATPPWEYDSDPTTPVRTLFAQLIGAEDSGDIAIVPSTAFAITLAAKNIAMKHQKEYAAADEDSKPDKILLLQDQFSSAVYPWQHICDQSNGTLVLEIVPPPAPGGSWTQQVLDRLDDSVIVACLPPLHWATGALLDLERIGIACRTHLNISLLVDATQAVGAMDFGRLDVIRPILLTCSIHKWLRAPSGASLVYFSKDIVSEWEALDQHGRCRFPSFDPATNEMAASGYPLEYVPDARKFDAGGRPNAIILAMLQASLSQVAQLNMSDVQRQLQILMEPLFVECKDLFEVPTTANTHRSHHLIGLRPKKPMTSDEMVKVVKDMVTHDKVFVAVRCGGFRISPYLDTTTEDVQRLVDSFKLRL